MRSCLAWKVHMHPIGSHRIVSLDLRHSLHFTSLHFKRPFRADGHRWDPRLGGPAGTFFWLRASALSFSTRVPRVRAVLGLRPPLLVRDMHREQAHVPNQVRRALDKALANGRDPQSQIFRRPFQWRPPAWPSRSLAWLLPRVSPLKASFTVVGTRPMPTLTPLHVASRARAEMCLLLVRAPREITSCTRLPSMRC